MEPVWIAAATLTVNVVVMLIGGAVAYARQESRMQAMVAQAQKESDERIDTTIRQFGETAIAIRQKITEVELFMRDNYIKRDSFYHGINELANNVKSLSDGLDGRLIRMESKIDAARLSQRESGGT